MSLTIWGFLSGLLLLIVPLYMLNALGVKSVPKMLRAFGRMLLWISLTGICLKVVFDCNHWAVTLLCLLLMAALGTVLTVSKARLSLRRYWIPVGVGQLVSAVVIGLYVLLAALNLRNPLEVRFFVPVMGLLIGSMTGSNAQALSTYYTGLLHHDSLYYYLLGNGASKGEAVAWFVRRALERTILPYAKHMATFVVGTTPLVLWALLLSGTGVIEAVGLQVLLLVAAFCASVVSLVVTLYVARRYAFDEYERLLKE